MTSTDTLLPCPFCGGEARISRAHQNKMLAMGEVPTDEHYLFTLYHDCANGITICWTYKPKDALIAAWNRRTPPTPATEEREAVARALYDHESPNSALAWEHKPAHFQENVRRFADAAILALTPFIAASIRTPPTPATEEREALGATVSAFWDTKDTVESCINAVLSALAPYRAAEILAAEANERARIAAYLNMRADQWRDLAVAHSGDALKWADCSARENELLRQSIAIERNKHGAGK